MKYKLYIFLFIFLSLSIFKTASAHQPNLIYLQPAGNVQITNPEVSRAFYDELKGKPRDYFIDSAKDFNLYINLLVPAPANQDTKYSARVFSLIGDKEQEIALIDGTATDWQIYFENFGRDYYYKGPEYEKQVLAGRYKIEIFSQDNLGKYVLAVGKTESFDIKSLLNVYWQLPLLKVMFFKTSVLQFFLTPFGIGGIAFLGALIILIFLINFIIGAIKEKIKHNQAKTMLLTSSGMTEMSDEIIKLLTKPAYDVNVGFVTTASKPEENKDYLQKDLEIMKEVGFNVEEIDIEGKTEAQLMQFFKIKDIIFVEGGNTFYLLNAMRRCNFEKVLRKLLKEGIVYIGVSAGSIVAGRMGLNLVPFDIFVHYQPEHAELIKQKIKNPKKRLKRLRIITDQQAILVQGKNYDLIGDGEQIIV